MFIYILTFKNYIYTVYFIAIIEYSINLYFKLKKDNIVGKNRIKYIQETFNIHINTLYNWISKYYNDNDNDNVFDFSHYKTNFKYNSVKIIENFVLNSIDNNNNFNI